MKNNIFIFQQENKEKWAAILANLNSAILKATADGKNGFKVEIKNYSKRSLNALSAYYCLLKTIEDWHEIISEEIGDIPIKKAVWDEYFKREAGLMEEVDLLPVWGFVKADGRARSSFVEKTRSLSNIGDVSKVEMERLINCVLKFGVDNEIEDCKIPNVELIRFFEKMKN